MRVASEPARCAPRFGLLPSPPQHPDHCRFAQVQHRLRGGNGGEPYGLEERGSGFSKCLDFGLFAFSRFC